MSYVYAVDGLTSAKELGSRIVEIADYLDLVTAGTIPINHPIVYQLQVWVCCLKCEPLTIQEIFNLLPNVEDEHFIQAVSSKTSDQMLCIYIAALTRATIAFHNLINNKVRVCSPSCHGSDVHTD
jgi:26S proteasome regulatory subunit N8